MKPSPVMEQYQAMKKEAGDAVLFFRMGDFYEMFYEDAETCSRALGIALTSRSKDDEGERIPMAGVPVKAAQGYLARMVRQGYKIAVCEQVEEASQAKGVVRREIVRIVTPGTLTEDDVLSAGDHNYLVAIRRTTEGVGVAWIDLSTGSFLAEDFPESEVLHHLVRIDPGEVLVGEDAAEVDEGLFARIRTETRAALTRRPDWMFRPERGRTKLLAHFKVHSLAGFGCDELEPSIGAAAALLDYLAETQKSEVGHLRPIARWPRRSRMILDRATLAALEVARTMREGDRKSTLLGTLDRTVTSMGARLLKDWVLAPLLDIEEIARRQDALAELVARPADREALRKLLQGVQDLERIAARISCMRAGPRELAGLAASLAPLPALVVRVGEAFAGGLLAETAARIDPLEDLAERLGRALADEVPASVSDGGVFRTGYHAELDEYRSLVADGDQWLLEYQAREAARSGIDSLKVGYNSVFGYFIEITHTHREKIPADYVRKQTLKNAERYITPELKEYETRALTADDKARRLERQLFEELRRGIAAEVGRLLETTDAIAHLDVLAGLAEVAALHRYVRPVVDDSTAIEIVDGRHPVLERTQPGSFVPNDLVLDDGRFVVVLTGPNMAGKSTYIRQMAQLVLLAQIGSFVPAARARIGLVDRVFTRIGAADEISRGRSTFMVEMEETANILNNATRRSFVVLDEVGRGTSTFDGVAIAWAITEHLHDSVRARTLFATHYHELTALAGILPGVANANVEVKEWNEEVIFLHKIVAGGCDRSYGIQVGRLAGLPGPVIERSREILHRLEGGSFDLAGLPAGRPRRKDSQVPQQIQLDLFGAQRDSVLETLRRLDLDNLTPLEALVQLKGLQDTLP